MAKKEQIWKGKSLGELNELSLKEFAVLVSSRERRKINRGFTAQEKVLMENIDNRNLETHCRDMIILPKMVGKTIKVHNGKEFSQIVIELDMLGHRLGEFAQTRKGVKHSAPGIGATRSSAAISVK